jgi:hypothetical protein
MPRQPPAMSFALAMLAIFHGFNYNRMIQG